ncbi:Rne/Rng family ribonuclease [Mesobacillus maritimus]|uniref:Rne/Rng family ribonuclease n=1 Tax=Mesobacillus maritimus TaxID=1643336 RepID=A0ABS7K1V2_9BACI|nr:Rne/Rng family ribonuclease [Mesobacillus maritimus]MBY0096228.1 Rne/Rng family ribonuclease [Mesobacillus maritimus]
MDQLIINALTREKRFALLKNEKLERLYIEQPDQQSLVGNIYLGVVEKVVPGMNAAFVQFGEEKSGFLFRDKLPSFVLDPRSKEEKANRSISGYLHQGEKLLVQVEKDAAGTKGAKLTAIIEIQGDHLIYMPSGKYTAVSKKVGEAEVKKKWRAFGEQLKTEEEGIIFRTSATSQTEETLKEEFERLRQDYQELALQVKNKKKPGIVMAKDFFYEELLSLMSSLRSGEVIADDQLLKKRLEGNKDNSSLDIRYHQKSENIFEAYGIEKEIERLLKRVVWLDNGAYLIFDIAEALTIIDVNTGRFSSKNDLRATVVATNKLAAKEIARQIRLRDLGGMILIDFIDMKNAEDREAVIKVLETALAEDGRRTRIAGLTELGILQLTRKKTKLTISEAMTTHCKVCSGTGRVLSAETLAFRLERELWDHRQSDYEAALIEATDEVIEVFSGENDVHRMRVEDAVGVKIFFSKRQSPKPDYNIRQLGTVKEISIKADK